MREIKKKLKREFFAGRDLNLNSKKIVFKGIGSGDFLFMYNTRAL